MSDPVPEALTLTVSTETFPNVFRAFQRLAIYRGLVGDAEAVIAGLTAAEVACLRGEGEDDLARISMRPDLQRVEELLNHFYCQNGMGEWEPESEASTPVALNRQVKARLLVLRCSLDLCLARVARTPDANSELWASALQLTTHFGHMLDALGHWHICVAGLPDSDVFPEELALRRLLGAVPEHVALDSLAHQAGGLAHG
ncbi:MAG: hypothetical protein HQL37_15805 [Alphaproteobacteria bacterium]|nr:hypothetical protein [Alphaproteobacteria bacterium]